MTTKTPGGKITGLLALTCEGQEALAVGDWVHLVGPYEVEKADGTKAVLGRISVKNVRRNSTTGVYPEANVPGDVTVEAKGFAVSVEVAGAAIDAGDEVGVDAAGDILPVGAGVAKIGVALTPAADGEEFDCLMQ